MKNKVITIIGLIQRIYNNNAPKKIKIDNDFWYFYKKSNGEVSYIDNEESYWRSCNLNFNYYIENNKLNYPVEILPEENDEWEDIEEMDTYHRGDKLLIVDKYYGDITGSLVDEVIADRVNQLIKNQKRIIEKLESKDD